MKSRAKQVLSKSVDAIVAAIEVYNKPTFAYREESFAILAITYWPGRVILGLGAGDDVMRTGSADMTGR